MEGNGNNVYRESYLRASAYKYASHNRADASIVDLPGVLTSGTPRLFQVALPSGFVFTTMTFWSGTTALATATNQWAALLDESRKVIAVSTDKTSAAWAAGAASVFTFSSTTLRRAPARYYAALMVAATTPPSLKGTLDSDAVIAALVPILGGNSATTGLTAPSAVGTVLGAITASGAKPLVMIG